MGLTKAFSGALEGTLADQWKDIITCGYFDEHMLVLPGILKQFNKDRGTNYKGSDGIITNGSKIYVPENTIAIIFNSSGIEEVIKEVGGYTYSNGQETVFNGKEDAADHKHSKGFLKVIADQTKERFTYGGQPCEKKQIVFVNMREIRGLKFGTANPLIYNDHFYGTDLSIQAYGTFSIKVTDPEKLIRSFVPANITTYSLDNLKARTQLLSELLQSFMSALSSLSTQYRISEIPLRVNEITSNIKHTETNVGTWDKRFGFSIISISINNIQLSPESRELIRGYSEKKMNLKAYEDVSQKASNIAAQQNIAKGIEQHGLSDGAGMLLGLNTNLTNVEPVFSKSELSINEQIATVKELKSLMDDGIITKEEFEIKKEQIMNL